eukprot:scaffold7837_cov83-Skeletonema_dohrnii-CCMP3373.AAC.1
MRNISSGMRHDVPILMNDHKKEKLLLMSLLVKTVIIHVTEIGLIGAFNCVMMICEHFVWRALSK